MSCMPLVMGRKLLGRFVPVGTAVGRVGCSVERRRLARARIPFMSGRQVDLGRDSARDLSPQDLVTGDVLLARTTPRPLPRNHGATLEDLATPDAPGLGPIDRTREALDPDGAVAAQRLGQVQLGGGVGEPQVGGEGPAREVPPYLHRHVRGPRPAPLPGTSLSVSFLAPVFWNNKS